jgi:hypothetical protein
VPLYLVEAWYKARGEEPYFEVLRCTLKELVDHQKAQKDKCVLFPAPPVFPVDYKWWNPEKGIYQEVVLDQPIEHFKWYMGILTLFAQLMGACIMRRRMLIEDN